MQQEKSQLRETLKARRAAMSPAARQRASVAILERLTALEWVRRATVFFVYVSVEPEVSTRALIDILIGRNRIVLVPKVTKTEGMKAVRFPGWSGMRPGALGIPSPADTQAYDGTIDVVIVPGLGFTIRGDRLGYGAGHYDRWLSRYRAGRSVAVAFEIQIVDHLPTDSNDVPVEQIATEKRLVDTGVRKPS